LLEIIEENNGYRAKIINNFTASPYLRAIDVQSMDYAILDNSTLLKYNQTSK